MKTAALLLVLINLTGYPPAQPTTPRVMGLMAHRDALDRVLIAANLGNAIQLYRETASGRLATVKGKLFVCPGDRCLGQPEGDQDWHLRSVAMCDGCDVVAVGAGFSGTFLWSISTGAARKVDTLRHSPEGVATFAVGRDQYFISSGWAGGCGSETRSPAPTLWRLRPELGLDRLQCLTAEIGAAVDWLGPVAAELAADPDLAGMVAAYRARRAAKAAGSGEYRAGWQVGDYLYLAGSDSVVDLYRITGTGDGVRLSYHSTPGIRAFWHYAPSFQRHGTRLLTSVATEAQVWDLSDPGRPRLVRTHTTPHWGGVVGWSRDGRYYMVAQLAGRVATVYRAGVGSVYGTWDLDPPPWPHLRLWGALPWRDGGWLVAGGSVAYTAAYTEDLTLLFADGFESGNTAAWSRPATRGGTGVSIAPRPGGFQ